ncbi:hypothetical protein [Nonomuraea sp. NEAU-A123]|uniref:hypothetical protein n=1 Tax=Nonomuraea sp. NEAU-A123 TaxID=2839649 RepID=UPI001BE498B9|nr:hypothetical protein [Nonomuraea sp. NEAU-A123]MBT2232303.1 hypothetical protein [Nonomuraea sp. NEAU-A123]
MSSGRNTVMIYLCVIGGVLLAGLVAFAPWEIWLSAVALALVVAVGSLYRFVMARRRTTAPIEPSSLYVPPPPPPVEPREQRVDQVPLPSQEDDYDFLFSAVVLWTPVDRLWDDKRVNLAALAMDAILKRAREITEHREPGRASLVAHELGGILGTMQKDPTGHVQAMAESVQVTLSAQDQERLDKLAEVRKDRVVWEHDRKYEQSKREYLEEDVLKDTGSAVVWWLVKNDDQVEKTVNDIGLLSTLASAANNRKLPDATSYEFSAMPSVNGASPVDDLAAFLHALDLEGQRDLFVHQIALLVHNYGRPDVAEEIVRRFDLAEPSAPPDSDARNDPDVDGQNPWNDQ